jgi:phosphoesterase RecJ-like protein
MIINDIIDALRSCGRAAIISHVMPDGDSIGSMLAMYNILKRMSKTVDVYCSDVVPVVYSFLPGYDYIRKSDDISVDRYDIAIVLDCGDIERTGKCAVIVNNSAKVVNIDHHITNSAFGSLNYVDTGASSTGELIYRIIKDMGLEIFKDEGECIYTAILTDTGCFKYSNTTPSTHRAAGDIINTGIDFGAIHDLVYRNYEYNNVIAMGKAIGSMELFCNGKIAYMQLLQDDLGELNIQDIDTNDFINYARDIKGVEAAVFIKQSADDRNEVSLRSKLKVDVSIICGKYGGGGHIKAAGCTICGSLQYVKDLIINELQQAI